MKTKKIFSLSIIIVLSIILFGCNSKNDDKYIQFIEQSNMYSNDFATALPQTTVYDIASEHIAKGSDHKVMIVGFDGARADVPYALLNKKELKGEIVNDKSIDSAFAYCKANGTLQLAYTGGKDIAKLTQESSTYSGWTTILTGKWADTHGVDANGVALNPEVPTILKSMALDGKKASFIARWGDYYDKLFKSEFDEKIYTALKVPTDYDVYQSMKTEADNGAQLVFGIFDNPDYNGHDNQFTLSNVDYVKAVIDTDKYAYSLIEYTKQLEEKTGDNWLVIITSDHGGHSKSHGTNQLYDRLIYIGTSK